MSRKISVGFKLIKTWMLINHIIKDVAITIICC